jgi:osmotically-inducible protein OsmY
VGVYDQITIKPHVEPRDVKTKIQAAFQRHAHQESNSIDVGVDGSSVTLTGVVDSWAERDAARIAAWAAPGVNEVIDNMRVAA